MKIFVQAPLSLSYQEQSQISGMSGGAPPNHGFRLLPIAFPLLPFSRHLDSTPGNAPLLFVLSL